MFEYFVDVLSTARLRSSVYCRSELGSPWGLHIASSSRAVFHVLCKGSGYFCLEGQTDALALQAGDVLLLATGDAHLLFESLDAPMLCNLKPDQWGEYALKRWSSNPAAVMLCGTFDFEYVETVMFLKQLPRVIHISSNANSSLNNVLTLMADEAEADRPAKTVVLRRLADVLFLQIIQQWIEIYGAQPGGWLGASGDPLIGKALALIHTQPQEPWTVASLASAVACSRSAFAARFTALVGEPPMEYLTRWRIQLASRWLIEQPESCVSEIAMRAGYRSEATFSRAFKRVTGFAPREFSLAQHQPGAARAHSEAAECAAQVSEQVGELAMP